MREKMNELLAEARSNLDDPESLANILRDVESEARFLEVRDKRVADFAAAVHNFADWQWGGYEEERDPQTFTAVRDALWGEVREHVEFYTGYHNTQDPHPREQADVSRSGGYDRAGDQLSPSGRAGTAQRRGD